MAERKCYFAAEIADMLGMSIDTFHRQRAALHAQGMPPSVTLGRIRINKQAFDAWFGRPQPRVAIAANDDAAAEDTREILRRAYAQGRLR